MKSPTTLKICLPSCSAYYGFLSKDLKTFISYYNLKGEGAPEYVDSVKQGNAGIPLKDVRLPDATAADVGKVLVVNDEGELVLQQAPAGGVKLYKHYIELENTDFTSSLVRITIITTDNTAITTTSRGGQNYFQISGQVLSAYASGYTSLSAYIVATNITVNNPSHENMYSIYCVCMSSTETKAIILLNSVGGGRIISDTVTEL